MDDLNLTTENSQLVGAQGDSIVILRPKNPMSRTEALQLAAWLVACADYNNQFNDLLEKVRNA